MKIDAVKTMNEIKKTLHDSSDFKSRTVQFFDTEILICYIADLTDDKLLNEFLINPICEYDGEKSNNLVDLLQNQVLANNEVSECLNTQQAIEKMLAGNSLVVVDGAEKILACDTEKIVVRAVSEPPTSVVIKGPREKGLMKV